MKNLQKHLMRATDKHDIRPALRGVEFNTEAKRMNATDSHRLLSFDYDGTLIENKIVDLNTMEVIEANYPNVLRIIARTGTDMVVNFSEINRSKISSLTKNKKAIIEVILENEVFTMRAKTLINSGLNSKMDIVELFTLKCKSNRPQAPYKVTGNKAHYRSNAVDAPSVVMYLNAEYLRDCLDFLLDYSKETKESTFTIRLTGKYHPLIFTGNKFDYLITPIRKN